MAMLSGLRAMNLARTAVGLFRLFRFHQHGRVEPDQLIAVGETLSRLVEGRPRLVVLLLFLKDQDGEVLGGRSPLPLVDEALRFV